MKASFTIGAAVFAVAAAAASQGAAQINKQVVLTKAQSPNACAAGYFAIPLEHPADKKFGQKYVCTGPQAVCSDGFKPGPATSLPNGKAAYACAQPLLPHPPPVPPNG